MNIKYDNTIEKIDYDKIETIDKRGRYDCDGWCVLQGFEGEDLEI